jgi:ATP-dependent RNA helicase DHX29
MSATVNAEKICAYFDDCPFIKVPGRTFPVQVNYLEDAVEMTRYFIGESSPFAIRGTYQLRCGRDLCAELRFGRQP